MGLSGCGGISRDCLKQCENNPGTALATPQQCTYTYMASGGTGGVVNSCALACWVQAGATCVDKV